VILGCMGVRPDGSSASSDALTCELSPPPTATDVSKDSFLEGVLPMDKLDYLDKN
jgi:hypothetical protein